MYNNDTHDQGPKSDCYPSTNPFELNIGPGVEKILKNKIIRALILKSRLQTTFVGFLNELQKYKE